MDKQKILIFHRNIAPYRVDFFNDLYRAHGAEICLYYRNLKSQKFDENKIREELVFSPDYFDKSIMLFGREIPVGFLKRLRKNNPDIVIVNEYSESYWIASLYRYLKRKKYKIITICDDSEEMARVTNGLHARARKLALRHIDGVILCNDLAKHVYKEIYPNVNTCVMPIIQNEARYLKNKGTILEKAKEIVVSEGLLNKRVFLQVARIAPEKNTLYLVKSFVENHNKFPENILYIIGDFIPENQNYNDAIEEYIRHHNAEEYIRRIGRKDGDELKAWYYAGQVLILPSVFEPFGAVTNEALICGNYVMVSSIAGSICLVDKSNGEVIDVSDECIDFCSINEKVGLLNIDYLYSKESKMIYSYNDYMLRLIEWINSI